MANQPLGGRVTPDYVAEAEHLVDQMRTRVDAAFASCARKIQEQARRRDDNHCGTEHVVLALYEIGGEAAKALDACDVSRPIFEGVLDEELGPSPAGEIPYTIRSIMIAGLAGIEATRLGSSAVRSDHLLLGVIRESERWEALGVGGPLHLKAAAAEVQREIKDIELELIKALTGR